MDTHVRIARLFAGACLGLLLANADAAALPPPRPKLVVAISVDQFGLDLFQQYRPTFTGGLKRLSEGLVFTGYQSHGATETCPGHSTILTGDHPSRTGIVANNWYDRNTGSNIYCVSKTGVADPLAKTSDLLRVDTLGDWMRRKDRRSRTIAVSGKDRAAIMMAGHHPTAVYWWDEGVGFNTSQYAGPADARSLAPAKAFDRRLFAAWRNQPPTLWPATIPDRCAALQKPYTYGKLALSGRIPPESAQGVESGPGWITDSTFTGELRASPLFDLLAVQFTEQLVAERGLGKGPATDLLALSLSGTDFIGHRFGSGGAETCVQLASIDGALGALFEQLDRQHIRYVVVLTADHGRLDAAERTGPPGRRVDVAAVIGGLNKQLRSQFGLEYDPLAGDDPRELIINLAPADDARRGAVQTAAIAWLKAQPDVADALTASDVAAAVPPPGKPVDQLTLAERFHLSFDRERSGDVMVAYPEFASLGVPQGPGATVAGHGSPWDYDRRVPILFWWPGVRPSNESRLMETVDIAPTLAAIVGVTPPAVDGRCVDVGQGCGR